MHYDPDLLQDEIVANAAEPHQLRWEHLLCCLSLSTSIWFVYNCLIYHRWFYTLLWVMTGQLVMYCTVADDHTW